MEFPEGFDVEGLLEPFDELVEHRGQLVPAWQVDASWRKAMCRFSPLRFAIVYMDHLLASDDTGGAVQFSQLHVDIAESARWWAPDADGTRWPQRIAWVAPRIAAKSTWLLRILPMWALAYGHRRFVLVVSGSSPQATAHAGNFRRDLSGAPRSARLLADFPHLRPWRRGQAGGRDSQATILLQAGVYAAQGINEQRQGLNIEGRPDVLQCDDLEPDEANYSLRERRKRERTLTQAILPMASPSAVVNISGVVTMYGSLMHDVVRAVDLARGDPRGQLAEWIAQERFACRHYPAIMDADTPRERSLWPVMWPLRKLRAARGTRSYALNYDGHPLPPGEGKHWHEQLFTRVDIDPVPGSRVMYLDVALTATATSDYQAMAIASQPIGMGNVVMVEFARGWQCSPSDLRDIVYSALAQNPDILEVHLEGNAGGDLWRDIFRDMPLGHKLDIYTAKSRKEMRISVLLDRYRRGEVVHRGRLPEAEEQMLAWPEVEHDDIVDAMAAAVAHFPLPTMTRV